MITVPDPAPLWPRIIAICAPKIFRAPVSLQVRKLVLQPWTKNCMEPPCAGDHYLPKWPLSTRLRISFQNTLKWQILRGRQSTVFKNQVHEQGGCYHLSDLVFTMNRKDYKLTKFSFKIEHNIQDDTLLWWSKRILKFGNLKQHNIPRSTSSWHSLYQQRLKLPLPRKYFGW